MNCLARLNELDSKRIPIEANLAQVIEALGELTVRRSFDFGGFVGHWVLFLVLAGILATSAVVAAAWHRSWLNSHRRTATRIGIISGVVSVLMLALVATLAAFAPSAEAWFILVGQLFALFGPRSIVAMMTRSARRQV